MGRLKEIAIGFHDLEIDQDMADQDTTYKKHKISYSLHDGEEKFGG